MGWNVYSYAVHKIIITPHAQRERGKVIGRGVHIYIYVTEHGKRAQLTWSIILYFFTLLEPALHYLTMDT